MSKVSELIASIHTALEELVRIEEAANESWRKATDVLNILDHELEIVPLNGGQLAKVASYRRKLRIDRRYHKNEWLLSKAFNDNFGTVRVLNSMNNARLHVRRQEKAGENLVEDRGLIASILAKPEIEVDKDIRIMQDQVAATIEKIEEAK